MLQKTMLYMETIKLMAFVVESPQPLGVIYHLAGFDYVAYKAAKNPIDVKSYNIEDIHLTAETFDKLAEEYFRFRKALNKPIQILYTIAIDDLYDSNNGKSDAPTIMRTRPFTNIEKNKFTAEIFHLLKMV